MKRDFSKKKYSVRRSQEKNRWGSVLLVGFIALLFSGIGFIGYQYKKQGPVYTAMSSSFSSLTTWMAERKSGMHNKIEKVKKLATNKIENDREPQIHFEFYTSLPNTEVTPNIVVAEKDAPKSIKAATVKADMKHNVITSAEDLEREFAKEIK